MDDNHAFHLGGLIANFQSLEFVLRAFLAARPEAEPFGIPNGEDFYALPIGATLAENPFTDYDSLGKLIAKFNAIAKDTGTTQIDSTLVEIRDALAHGRVSAPMVNNTLRLLKFSKPKDGMVTITLFLVRTCGDRLAGDGRHTIAAAMRRVKVKAVHEVEVRDAKGKMSQATVKVKYYRLRVYPPIGKQKEHPPLLLTVIYAQESSTPRGREKIDWKLITNLPVRSRKDAVEKLAWYAMRWRIETFHKILKSGCRAEASKLRAAQRIVNLIAVFCVLSWRIFWMTMMNRVAPTASPLVALTNVETLLLDTPFQERPPVVRRCSPPISSRLLA